jgi:CubicO group peptidase (beta-lactamase class C family)
MKTPAAKLLILFLFISAGKVFSQPVSDPVIQKINAIFAKWNNPNSPGCAVGIVRNDTLLFAKGYGMANLEYGIPITPETIFHVASISKQFTGYAIVLLAKQGKLHLDDDIHKYLPWFPDFKEKITIRHLLNHTSGIRDHWQLLAISGTRLNDVIKQEHIMKVLGKQQALNSKPGERFNYSNSGYAMLAEIVRSVTGQTLRQFTDSAIFKPLGMANTNFHDEATEIVKNRSYSYSRTDSIHFANSILSYSNSGATSLFTNINDMHKWIMNFYRHQVGDQKDIDLLTGKGKLNNGKEINYALGVSSDIYKGWRVFDHAGSDAGYRTFLAVFPDVKMGIVVFSNLADVIPANLVFKVADLFITDTTMQSGAEASKKIDSSKSILKDTASMKIFTGNYIGEDGFQVGFRLNNKKLFTDLFDEPMILCKGDKDTFSLLVNPQIKFVFNNPAAGDTLVLIDMAGEKRLLKKYQTKATLSDEVLKTYTGTYYCPELECRYGIVLKDHQLVLTNNKYSDMPLTLIGRDHLLGQHWWMNHLLVLRNSKKQVTGFEVNCNRVLHLRFNKIE